MLKRAKFSLKEPEIYFIRKQNTSYTRKTKQQLNIMTALIVNDIKDIVYDNRDTDDSDSDEETDNHVQKDEEDDDENKENPDSDSSDDEADTDDKENDESDNESDAESDGVSIVSNVETIVKVPTKKNAKKVKETPHSKRMKLVYDSFDHVESNIWCDMKMANENHDTFEMWCHEHLHIREDILVNLRRQYNSMKVYGSLYGYEIRSVKDVLTSWHLVKA
jgi:cobalamin biosynthesis protein CobT